MGKHEASSPYSWARDMLGDESKRRAIYGLATAVLAILTAWGILSADDAATVAEAVASGLGCLATLLARANTGTGDGQ